MHFAVASCMRNEAIFLLEWVAYQHVVGFDSIVVATNDCTDGTDAICDELAKAGVLHHVHNTVAPGQAPQMAGMARVLALPVMETVDYLLHCDADEFLNVSCGDGRVADLIDTIGPADCIALAWRPFGDAGIETWDGGLVIERFDRSAPNLWPAIIMHKSMFKPRRFGRAIDHMPKDPVDPSAKLVNTKGEEMSNFSLYHPTHARFRRSPDALLTWENACLHHYAIQSQDVFLMKNLRGDGMAAETKK